MDVGLEIPDKYSGYPRCKVRPCSEQGRYSVVEYSDPKAEKPFHGPRFPKYCGTHLIEKYGTAALLGIIEAIIDRLHRRDLL